MSNDHGWKAWSRSCATKSVACANDATTERIFHHRLRRTIGLRKLFVIWDTNWTGVNKLSSALSDYIDEEGIETQRRIACISIVWYWASVVALLAVFAHFILSRKGYVLRISSPFHVFVDNKSLGSEHTSKYSNEIPDAYTSYCLDHCYQAEQLLQAAVGAGGGR